jgi:hypothetical protein
MAREISRYIYRPNPAVLIWDMVRITFRSMTSIGYSSIAFSGTVREIIV